MSDLLRRLDRPPDARLVILTAEGLGETNASNEGVYQALRHGAATTAALSVPCPWSRTAARDYSGEDIGVSLTVSAPYECYRWGPITHAPSLLDGAGAFPGTAQDLWDHAEQAELRRECQAQLERAVLWGFDVTHLHPHLWTLAGRPELFDVMLELAIEYRLPLSLPDVGYDPGFDPRKLAALEGVAVADRTVSAPPGEPARWPFDHALRTLEPGVTEFRFRPAVDHPELRAVTPNWQARVDDAHLATGDWTFRDALNRAGVELIGFRELRAAQRS